MASGSPRLAVDGLAGPGSPRLLALEAFESGAVVGALAGRPVRERSALSVQTGANTHLVDLGDLAFLRHSCRPNVAVCVERMEVLALRPIAPGEELTCFYPSTEWEMARPFVCRCGAQECVGVVAGAKFLTAGALGQFYMSEHIRRQIMAALSVQGARLLRGTRSVAGGA